MNPCVSGLSFKSYTGQSVTLNRTHDLDKCQFPLCNNDNPNQNLLFITHSYTLTLFKPNVLYICLTNLICYHKNNLMRKNKHSVSKTLSPNECKISFSKYSSKKDTKT